MIFGVRTEEGIQKSSSLYLKSKAFPLSFKSTDVKEVIFVCRFRFLIIF